MKRSLLLVFLLLSPCLLSVTVLPASAADYSKIGVKVGDTADYNVVDPLGIAVATRIERMHVDNIAGTTVTLRFTILNSNGSETPYNTLTGNVSDSQILFSGIYRFLVAANLTVGDPIFNGTGEIISKESTMIVAGVNRTVNYFQLSGGTPYDIYWDKTTGLMVRSFLHIPYDGDLTWELTATTVFQSEADYLVVTVALLGCVLAGAVIAVLAAAIVRRKKELGRR